MDTALQVQLQSQRPQEPSNFPGYVANELFNGSCFAVLPPTPNEPAAPGCSIRRRIGSNAVTNTLGHASSLVLGVETCICLGQELHLIMPMCVPGPRIRPSGSCREGLFLGLHRRVASDAILQSSNATSLQRHQSSGSNGRQRKRQLVGVVSGDLLTVLITYRVVLTDGKRFFGHLGITS
ncbi:uncharacterized protein B0H64DRAFT_224189 [Chaetomium fimeti]|uniref:Uncharacterized protein n=1 Tax=Chaetomium fimeti TaxID=1854472 RepID=A0AAE0H9B2_9PEZI|nr:hypothetical protein B0H64DRAFT_224189 [Chaetomium fimeti]